MPNPTGPTSEKTRRLIAELRKSKEKTNLALAKYLEKPARNKKPINIQRLNGFSKKHKDLIVPGRGFPFRPGMTASADIQTRSKQNVLSVPLNAVTTRDASDSSSAKTADKKDEKAPAPATASTDAPKSVSSDDSIQEVVFVLQKRASRPKKWHPPT